MADAKLVESWMVTTSYLERGFAFLDGVSHDLTGNSLIQLRQQFEEYIEHIELGLALDTLESIGDRTDVPGGFWRALENAATQMALATRADQLHTKMLHALDRKNHDDG